ncbi:hypothetical protein AGMMS49991_10120 [Spirochaetia bacterium]|nr:hypothetical protein AGMMS49991_10120 [Spirochaetia bacterium]
MTNKKHLLFALLPVLLFFSCGDPMSTTVIKISNNSSYDLHLDFENSDGVGMFLILDVSKNQSVSREYGVMGNTAPDPNWGVKSIAFVDLDTNETIAEKSALGLKLFVLESLDFESNTLTGGSETAVYSLTITDTMLEP